MKFTTVVIVLSLSLGVMFSPNAKADSTEKPLGQVVAVERTYTFDIAKLKDACKTSPGSGYVECRVQPFPVNGTELAYDRLTGVQTGSEPIQMTVKDSTSDIDVSFYVTATGYSASLSTHDGSELQLYHAQTILQKAYYQGGVANVKMTMKVMLVK